jgi:hypothetical protein
MKMNMLASAISLSNNALLTRLPQLAATERTSSAELVAHLVALDMRPDVHAAEGYGSLFGYCTRVLRLSEDAACTRLAAVSACRRFPTILDLLVSGDLNLTTVRRVGPHLTAENCDAVLVRAVNRTQSEIDKLLAELNPKDDVKPCIRRLPVPRSSAPAMSSPADAVGPGPLLPLATVDPEPTSSALPQPAPVPTRPSPARRPVIRASAPSRYSMHFSVGDETHAKFRRVQTLLRRELPSGDPGLIFDRALDLLLEEIETKKLGKAAKPRRPGASIRSGTDKVSARDPRSNRHIPNTVKREVWKRDEGRCAFVSEAGNRCGEQSYLEFHHIQPYALGGPATVANVSLRCRRHNQYEGKLVFGSCGASTTGEPVAAYGIESPSAWHPVDGSGRVSEGDARGRGVADRPQPRWARTSPSSGP